MVATCSIPAATAVAAAIGSHHVRAATKIPIVTGSNGALDGKSAIVAQYDVPELRIVTKRLGGKRHVLVVFVIAPSRIDKQVARSFAAESVARLCFRHNPIGISCPLLFACNVVDVRVDTMISTQAHKAILLGARNIINAIGNKSVGKGLYRKASKTCKDSYK